MRAALNALAVVAPEWLQTQSQPEWIERYSERIEDYHLPTSDSRREQQAQRYGDDGWQLLDAIFATTSPGWLRQVPAVEIGCDKSGFNNTTTVRVVCVGARKKKFHRLA
jgi:transposase